MDDWKGEEDGDWLDQQRLDDFDEVDKMLVQALEITYMTGKGNNHLVPIIFPPDIIEAIRVLCDPLVRAQVDVSENNRYVFPSI